MASELAGMVLRCEKTGKLFFSSKEAELHSEETGLKDFSQVSPEEKIWKCEETGKVCFNQQQVDLHKRRVPEAQTFTEGTIADLKPAPASASTGEAVEMETEEEQLLRQAGIKSKKSLAAASAGPTIVTKESVDQLVEMGFTQLRAEKALVKTSNAGLESAINWLTDHLDDADIDEPLETPPEMKTQEEVDALAASSMGGGSSSSQLTPAEKKAKLDEALAKARAKKAGTSVEEYKQMERARREDGKQLLAARREQEDQQRKRDLEMRQREKREFEEERRKLREKLAADKEERIKKGLLVPAAAKPAASAPAPAPAAAKPRVPKTEAEREAAAAAAAAAGLKRSYDEEPLSLEEATAKLTNLSDTRLRPALELMKKMADNIAKNPAEPKYRKMRLSNPKVADGLVHVPGARQFLRAIGWALVEEEFLQLPIEADAGKQVAAVAALAEAALKAQEARRVAELEARKREAAEKAAKAKAERDAIKAAMLKDRAEVAARGPAQASVGRKLPSESAGMSSMSRILDEQDAQDRANAS